MKEIKLKPSQWVALSCILLVLVGSLLAYSAYVPKLQEIETMKTQLTLAKIEQTRLRKIAVPKKVLPEDKVRLASLVPTDFDQARFIKTVRDAERATSVKLTEMTFQQQQAGDDANEATQQKATTGGKSTVKTTTAPANNKSNTPQQSALTEQKGHLTVTGNYQQVRQFIESFSKIGRLVAFNHWDLHTEETKNNDSLIAIPPSEAQTSNAMNILIADPLLSNRSPILSEQEYEALVNDIMKKAPLLKTQRDKDLVNLELQQTKNRYLAGLNKQKEAISILTQDVAGTYIPDANTNIREVLGLVTGTPAHAMSLPTSLLGNPIQTHAGDTVSTTSVMLDIDFTIYYVPNAKDLLPAPQPIKTYDP
ncbi:MAG: hypothetical protein ACXVDE_06920, partial [Tumebacillaceae bacterium]